jgi:hypothetical protein
MRINGRQLAALLFGAILGTSALSQQVAPLDFKSVGRGAPLADDANKFPLVGSAIPWSRSAFEYSNQMQTIEIYTPNRDANGNFLGLNHEAVFYDPEALVEPIRIVRNLVKIGDYTDSVPYAFVECTPTIYPVEGTATPVAPGQIIQHEVPDMYGRPWAQIWEKCWEEGMQREADEDIFDFN